MKKLDFLYNATNNGLDIIQDLVPQITESINNTKRKFKFRLDERTPSAMLYAPSQKRPYWHIVDYGASEGKRSMSPIDIYMFEKGYNSSDFNRALDELSIRYGVQQQLSPKTNKPIWKEPRQALDSEKEKSLVFKIREGGFTDAELRVWGSSVREAHLLSLGWQPLLWSGFVKNGMVRECHSTESYPQFIQRCVHIEKDGSETVFYKVYKPYEPHKEFRFVSSATVPKDFVFGLECLKRAYNKNDANKLPYVALVSGGSDAANCLAMGVQPVWLQSETAELSSSAYTTLLKYAEKIVSIPDMDATGIRVGKRRALQYINMHTLWLPLDVLGASVDNRGRQRKDLKDYLQLRPSKADFIQLVSQALSARFWHFVQDKNGKKHPEISLVALTHFLDLNNICTLRDTHSKEPRFIRIEGAVVEETNIKGIVQFLADWMHKNAVYQSVQDKVLRSKDIYSHIANTLPEVDLDFSTGSATSQWFYFQNYAVEVTAEGIFKHHYSQLADTKHFVWKHSIIPHNYVEHAPMFNISANDDGTFSIQVLSTKSCLFSFFINASRNFWRKELELQFADKPEKYDSYINSHKFCINGEGLSDEEIAEQMQSLVNKLFAYGYLMHSYKVMSRAWSVMLLDSRIGTTNDECNGRSGKSVWGKSAKIVKKVYPVEAKNPRIVERQFLFAGVDEDTDIVHIDECHRSLDYNFFFGRVTDDFQIERKGIDPYAIPFCKSPKMLIATNYVIRDTDPSAEARMLFVVFSDYYHQQAKSNDYKESRSVRDDFGFNLFDDMYTGWDADYAFILQCTQWYLSVVDGDRKILPPMENIDKRQQKAKIGIRFEEWAADYFQDGSGHLDTKLKESDVYTSYSTEIGHKKAVEIDIFRKKLIEYCQYAENISCYNPKDITKNVEDGKRWRIHETSGQVVYIYIRSVKKAESMNAEQVPTSPSPVANHHDISSDPGLYENDMAF